MFNACSMAVCCSCSMHLFTVQCIPHMFWSLLCIFCWCWPTIFFCWYRHFGYCCCIYPLPYCPLVACLPEYAIDDKISKGNTRPVVANEDISILRFLGCVMSFPSLRLSGFVYYRHLLTWYTSLPKPQLWHQIIPKEKDKGMGESKSEKPRVHWTLSNKKLFLDLALGEKHKGNWPDKAFNAIGWKNIIKAFNERTDLQYQYLQFKNLYSQLRSSW